MGKDYYAILGGLAKDVSHLSPDLCALSKLQHRRHGSSQLRSRSWRGEGEMHEKEWLGNPYVHHHRVAKFFLPHVDASVLNPRDRLRSGQHRARGQGPSHRTWVLLRPPRQLSSTLLWSLVNFMAVCVRVRVCLRACAYVWARLQPRNGRTIVCAVHAARKDAPSRR